MARASVLFVCMGNICRSPLAEGAFRMEAERLGLDVIVDSAGTGGWHAGDPPDRRSVAVARRNLEGLRAVAPRDTSAEVGLLLDLVPGHEGRAVADPYYGDDAGFEVTWRDVVLGARALARRLVDEGWR